MARLNPGLSAEMTHTVTTTDSAENWANELPVLATPVLLWLAEVTCMRALEKHLGPGEMTLGLSHEVRHLAPTPVGDEILLRAELEDASDGLLRFRVHAHDSEEPILDGQHSRALVHRERFMRRVDAKAQRLPQTSGSTAAAG